MAEIKQRAEILVAECKSGPAADGLLVADLGAAANDRAMMTMSFGAQQVKQ